MAEPKAHRVERSKAWTYLGKADEFLTAAKTALAAEYEDRRVSAKEADTGTRRAERFVGWATAQVARART